MKIAFILLLIASFSSQADVPLSAIRTQDAHSICTTKTRTIRDVSRKIAKFVYKRDGVPGGNHTGICLNPDDPKGRGCELDHRASLELGGSNDPTNLQIQPYFGNCNADDKDRLENKLHDMICENQISVSEAQDLIYNDWKRGYELYIDSRGCEL